LNNYYKRGLLGLEIQGDVATGEQLTVAYERMSGRENELRIQSDRPRQYAVTMSHKLGAGTDFRKITIKGLPTAASQPTAMNFQPGTGVIDVLSGNGTAAIQILVDGVIGGNKVRSIFNTQFQRGQRLVVPNLGDPGRLKMEAIDNLLGPGRAPRIVNKQ
jgi:hypothetical protein